MAEVRNTFLASKMNKDLDARIVPNGEYRDAQNVSINTSEGADVGALENVLGNISKTNFGLSSNCKLKTIGYYMDDINDRIFVLLTDYTDTSNDKVSNHSYNSSAASYICVYNFNSNSYTILVSGSWLNFSTTHPIYGINVLENYLFWTDNRNQPRKININTAIANPADSPFPYYTKEQQVSVAKYTPYQPIKLYTGTAPNAVSTMLDVVSPYLPNNITPNPNRDTNFTGDSEFLVDKMPRFSYRFKYDDGEYSLFAPFTQITFIPKQDGYFIKNASTLNPGGGPQDDQARVYKSTDVYFMENKVNVIKLQIPAPDIGNPGSGLWSNAFNNFKISEIDVIYKESDGLAVKIVDTITREQFETSGADFEFIYNSTKPYKTLATKDTVRVSDVVPIRALAQQVAGNRVIYGNFINKHTSPKALNYAATVATKGSYINGVINPTPITSTVRKEYQNHTLKQNRNYQVGIILQDAYGRQSSVILSSLLSTSGSADTIYHPYRTSIATPDLTTATDTWPGDALVVEFNDIIPTTKEEGYPGIWALDNPLGWLTYKVVVKQTEQDYYNVYFPGLINGYSGPAASAASASDPIGHFMVHSDNINKVPKDLLNVGPTQVLFTSSPNPSGELESPVLDDEILNAIPPDAGSEYWENLVGGIIQAQQGAKEVINNTSLRLYGRVMNTSATLNAQHYIEEGVFPNINPVKKSDVTITLGNVSDLYLATIATPPVEAAIYNVENNPMMARVNIEDIGMGVTSIAPGNMLPLLAVYETKPKESRLEIFWETSTSGNITQLNSGISGEISGGVLKLGDWTAFLGPPIIYGTPPQSDFIENQASGSTIVKTFSGFDNSSAPNIAWPPVAGTNEIILLSAVDGNGSDVTSSFNLIPSQYTVAPYNVTLYHITTNATFASFGTPEDYITFSLKCIAGGIITYQTIFAPLENIKPAFNPAGPATPSGNIDGATALHTLIAQNGSVNTTLFGQNLFFSITSQVLQSAPGVQVDLFYLNNQTINSANRGQIELFNTPTTSERAGVYVVDVEVADRQGTSTTFVDTFQLTVTLTV